jgi:hypothetical protein
MEHFWSPAIATAGNPWQMGRPPERLRQAKTVAMSCDWLPETLHSKEEVTALAGLLPAKKPTRLHAYYTGPAG